MTYYEHKRFWSPIVVLVGLALGTPAVLTVWDSPGDILALWPAHLIVGSIWTWFYFMSGRHANRHLRVDQDGVWIDEELAVEAQDIIAIDVVNDPRFGSLHEVGGPHLPGPGDDPTKRGTIWLQRNWARIVEAPAVGETGVVTRARDLARGSGMDSIMVLTEQWYAQGLREAWLLATYRPVQLAEALFRAAPHAQAAFVDEVPAPGTAAPGIATGDVDDPAG